LGPTSKEGRRGEEGTEERKREGEGKRTGREDPSGTPPTFLTD